MSRRGRSPATRTRHTGFGNASEKKCSNPIMAPVAILAQVGDGPPPHLPKAGGARTSRTQVAPGRSKGHGGRSDPRASYPNPATSGRGEKLPTAIPIFQPWSRCHRDYAGWLMTSVETKRKHWQRSWSKVVSRPEGEHGSLTGWFWPHMTITSEGLKITTLPRQGSYGNCLRVQSWIHEKLGHPERFTLHSPKFYMPTLAGQVGLSLEERNQMCHWSPSSTMPLVYDRMPLLCRIGCKRQDQEGVACRLRARCIL